MNAAEWSALRLSLVVAGAALLVILPPGVALGWLLARRRFPGRTLIEAVVFLPLVMPPVVTGYFLLVVFGRSGWIGRTLHDRFGIDVVFTLAGMILAAGVMGFPLLVRSVRLAMEAVDPGLTDAARTLGYSRARAFFTVTLPLTRSGILAGAVLAFARALGEFGATMMVAANTPGRRTIALEIYRLAATPGGEAAVGRLVLLSIFLSLAALLASEWAARRFRSVGP